MKTKKLTDQEKIDVKLELESLLQSYKPEVVVSDEPVVVHCGVQKGGEPWRRWDELVYSFVIKTTKGDFENSQSINENWIPKDVAWIIAHEFFLSKDGDINGPLAQKLWKN